MTKASLDDLLIVGFHRGPFGDSHNPWHFLLCECAKTGDQAQSCHNGCSHEILQQRLHVIVPSLRAVQRR
jgi:hypothetical protein